MSLFDLSVGIMFHHIDLLRCFVKNIGKNVILNAEVVENHKVIDPSKPFEVEEDVFKNVLRGYNFQCKDLLQFIAGTFEVKKLREHRFEDSPKEFTIETWVSQRDCEWQLKKKTTWHDILWLDANHTTKGETAACAGIANFVYGNKTVEEIENGEILVTESSTLRKVIFKNMCDPKYPDNYLG